MDAIGYIDGKTRETVSVYKDFNGEAFVSKTYFSKDTGEPEPIPQVMHVHPELLLKRKAKLEAELADINALLADMDAAPIPDPPVEEPIEDGKTI